MQMQLIDFAAQIAGQGAIAACDVQSLRRSIRAGGKIDPSEAADIVAINQLIAKPTLEWSAFFVEALSTWLIDQQQPFGEIGEAQAAWLTEQLGRGETLNGRDEIELLVRCLEQATRVPASLRQFALIRTEQFVLASTDGAKLRITADHVELLRRLIFAHGDSSDHQVGRAEADMLVRIKDAALGAANAPGWQQLFVEAVGSYLQGFSGARPLDPAHEAELADFICCRAVGIGRFFERLRQAYPSALAHDPKDPVMPDDDPKASVVRTSWAGFSLLRLKPRAAPQSDKVLAYAANRPIVYNHEAAMAKRRVTDQASWLEHIIQADNEIDSLEKALLDHLKAA
jgi:hypothetical protein